MSRVEPYRLNIWMISLTAYMMSRTLRVVFCMSLTILRMSWSLKFFMELFSFRIR
nr:MAG TPA_asm: hypothetical protein [Caudoviricetes sp.]